MTVVVRRAEPTDSRSLAAVHLETVTVAYADIFPSYAEPPSFESLVDDWQSSFTDPTSVALLVEDSECRAVVGTVGVRSDPDFDGCGQLRRLHVLPGRWDSGLGSALHDAAIREIRDAGYQRAGLWVLEANARARLFYERRGWELVPGPTLEIHGPGSLEVRYRLGLG